MTKLEHPNATVPDSVDVPRVGALRSGVAGIAGIAGIGYPNSTSRANAIASASGGSVVPSTSANGAVSVL